MKTTITKVTAVFLAIFLTTVVAFSQTIVTTVPTITTCPGQTGTLSFNVTVTNFTAIGSISLILKYNPLVMTYAGYTQNPALASGTTIINGIGSQIACAWFTLSSTTIPNDGILFTFNFNYLGGNGNLTWDTINAGNCQYSDENANPLPALFISGGAVVATAPSLITNPADITVTPGNNAIFTVQTSGAATYQWQESTDGGTTWTDLVLAPPYSGVTNDTLTITSVTDPMNGYRYRAIATTIACNFTTTSTSGQLTVSAGCPFPLEYNVTGGGSYCADSAGVMIGLDNSEIGVTYDLINGGFQTGFSLIGTGSALSFGPITAPGTYTINGTNTCGTSTMIDTAIVVVLPAPFVFNVTGTGSYCAGGMDLPVGLDSTEIGTTYELYFNGVISGSPLSGTGSALSFGNFTAAGEYTIKGTNACGTEWMFGIATISINPLPTIYTVTSSGVNCPLGLGVSIALSNSEVGVNYELYLDGIATSNVIAGTGSSITFTGITTPGNYEINASTTSGACTAFMDGIANVSNGMTLQVVQNPADFSTSSGSNASFNVITNFADPDLTFQWMVKPFGGLVFINITNGGNYSGANTSTLSVLNTPYAFSGNQYRVIITDPACNQTVNSLDATLTVSQATIINVYLPTIAGAVPGSTLSIPVTVENIENAGAISLVFLYNNATLTYQGYSGVNPALASGIVSVNGLGGQLKFAWFDVTPISILSGTLFAADFTYNGGPTDLTWDLVTPGYCEFADASNNILPANYFNGSITACILPTTYDVTGGGSYCAGGPGMLVIIDNTQADATYEVFVDGVSTGFTFPGDGSSMQFNFQAAGVYTIVGTNLCESQLMPGSATISILPTPTIYDITGDSAVACVNGSGVSITLNGSVTGTDYQLFLNGSTLITTIAGTGDPIVFSGINTPGDYTVYAVYGICSLWMNGTFKVTPGFNLIITQDPASVTIPAGGSTSFTVSGSPVSGLTYQWQVSLDGILFTDLVNDVYYSGVNSATLSITNAPYSFNGNLYRSILTEPVCNISATSLAASLTVTQSVAINTYLPVIVGTIPGTTVSIPVTVENVAGVAAISLSYLYDNTILTYQGYSNLNPSLSAGIYSFNDLGGELKFSWFDVTPITILSGTLFNIDYLFNGGTSALTWNVTIPGNCEYTDINDNILNANFINGSITGCTFPIAFNVVGGGTMCPGGIGIEIGLDGSEIGATYTLYLDGTTTSQTLNGTGTALSYGLQTAGGVYTIAGNNSCGTVTMIGSAVINFQAPPSLFSVTGGGTYCLGNTSPSVGLDGSEIGVTYTIYNNGINTGQTLAGTGSALDFGAQTAAGTYTIHGANICSTVIMGGNATIIVNVLPAVYVVTGGGNYCTGGTGLDVHLSGSEVGATYELFLDGVSTGTSLAGTGNTISFVNQTVAGVYTVVATNNCGNSTMTGAVTIVIDPVPQVFTVTGGGAYCTGGAGVMIGLSGSESNATYTILYNGVSTGTTISGTGNAISFGMFTGIGTYTVSATNACGTTPMDGNAIVTANTLPAVFTMTGGGNFIAGGSGVNVGLDGSETGVNYSLFLDGVFTGQVLAGNGIALSFGDQTSPGTYTVLATDATTSCTSLMNGSSLVTVTPIIVSDPVDLSIYEGYSGSFTVVALGATIYQWQVSFDGGLTWVNLTNTPPYYNVNTTQLDIIGATLGMNGYMFRAVVSNSTSPLIYSNGATLYVTPAPVLTTIAPTMTAAPNTSILVPIDVLNYGGISAFNLTLTYDPSVLTYTGMTNINPALATGNEIIITNGAIPGLFLIAYYSIVPSTIGDGKLFDLQFNFSNGFSPLVWKIIPHEGAEYANTVAIILPSIWIHGSVNSNSGTIITVQPVDATACEGGSATYSITAPGATTYQWMATQDYGITWFDLVNSALFSGVNTNTLTVNGISPTMADFLFACKVDMGTAYAAVSNPASLTITPFITVPGTISAYPGTTICPGNNVTFSVNAAYDLTGATYQWYVNSIPVSSTATYSTSTLVEGDVVKVDVYVAGSCAFLDIPTVTMVIDPHPVVTTSPADVIAVIGDNPSFTVVGFAPGNSPLSYQWQISIDNGNTWTNLSDVAPYSGVTTATLLITSATLNMDGHLFRVIVTEGTCGNSVTSDDAKLFMFFGPIITKLEDQVVCGNSTLVVPVKVDNFIDVASISLKLNYDPAFLTYTGYQNINPALTADPLSLFTVNSTGTQVAIFSFTLTPVSLSNESVMVELLFVPTAGTTVLDWDDQTFGNCMYTNLAGTVIPDIYINATITINPLPAIFAVTGGGDYCVDGSGQPVGLSGSEVGITYELFNNNFTTFLTLPGTGSALSFGNQFAAGVYTIYATDNVTGCTQIMGGSAIIVINPLPVVTFAGTLAVQCLGGEGYVLTGGTPAGGTYSGPGVLNGIFYPAIAGVGIHTLTYSYQDPDNGCINSATNIISVIHGPLSHTITGGGSYCPGGSGAYVGLSNSEIGMLYQIQINGIINGPYVGGTGFPITFGLQTIPGVYTILATDPNTGCTLVMDGSVTIVVNPLPTAFALTGGGSYCPGGSGVVVGLSGSESGVNYQLVFNNNNVGGPVAGTGSAISFGLQTQAGTYIVIATNTTTGCVNTMTGNVTITISSLPFVSFAGYIPAQCFSDTSFALTNGFPYGGTYSGNGVTGNNFNASVAGLGVHVITYTYTDPNTGCTNFAVNYITVNADPTVSWVSPLAAVCADNNSYVLSGGFPVGGVYSGPGVTGNVFNASLIGPGTYTLTYYFTDQSTGCFATATNTITVNPLPVVTWNGSITALCADATALTLTGGFPAGGTYSGPGVAGNTFNPALVGVGTYTLTYTYTDPATNCTGFVTNIIIVNPLPVVTFGGKLETQCSSSTALLLLTGYPAGGTYSGIGVTGNIFNASVAGLGTFVITYTYTDPITGCTNFATNEVTVVPGPTVTWTAQLLDQCANATNYVLPSGVPAGGVFSGPGVVGNVFNASLVGPGTYTLAYSYTYTGSGCSGSTSNTIVVLPPPALTWSNVLTSQCITSNSYTLTGASPAGGIYSGAGVVGNNFDASVAGLGLHILTYTYTDANGCTNSITNTITVVPLPIVTWTGTLTDQCASATTYTLTGGIPSGGTYSGPGVVGSNFNASLVGTGVYTLTYSYTNPATGCTNSTTKTITVTSGLPVFWTNTLPSPCQSVTAVVLSGATPPGGTYSGPGVTAGVFNPSLVGPGSYTLTYTYTDALGCTGTATNTIIVGANPLVTWANILTTQCAYDNFYLLSGGSPLGGTYSGPGVFGTNFNASNVGPGTYTLTYTYTTGAGCTNSATNTITVSELPTVTLGPDQNVCFGTSTTITATASAGVTFVWNTGAITPSITVVVGDTTTYSVTVTNANGCTATATMNVNMLPLPNAQTSAIPKTICQGESSTLYATGGSGPTPYLWNTGQTTPSFVSNNNQDTTVFYVTVTNTYGCTSVANITLNVNVVPVVMLNGGVPQVTACNYTIFSFVPGPGPYDTYLWNTGEQTTTLNVATDLLGASTFNTFSVTVTLNGCQAKDDIILFVDPCGAIQEVGTQELIQIYPNPTDGRITINLENVGEGMSFDIYNSLGQRLYNEKLTNDNHSRYTKDFDLSAYPVGIYFLRFADGTRVISRKLIVK